MTGVRFVGAVGGSKSVTGGVVTDSVLLSTKLPAASAARTLTVYVVDGVRSKITRPLAPIWLAKYGLPLMKSV